MTSEAEEGIHQIRYLGEEVPYDPEDFTENEAAAGSPTATANDATATVQPPKPKPQRRLWKNPVFIATAALLCTFSALMGKASVGIAAHKQATVQATAKGRFSKGSKSPKSSKTPKGYGGYYYYSKGGKSKSSKNGGYGYYYGGYYYYYFFKADRRLQVKDPDFEEGELAPSDAATNSNDGA